MAEQAYSLFGCVPARAAFPAPSGQLGPSRASSLQVTSQSVSGWPAPSFWSPAQPAAFNISSAALMPFV